MIFENQKIVLFKLDLSTYLTQIAEEEAQSSFNISQNFFQLITKHDLFYNKSQHFDSEF